jgi:TM2 domain-containing membrane protein YozV
MKILILLSLFSILFLIHLSTTSGACTTDSDCNNGKCDATTTKQCQCEKGYVTFKNVTCSYKQKEKLTAFLLSFLVGGLGADWFYLASGNAGYIVAGVFKLLTAGGLGVWFLVDWIRVLCDSFNDGNGVALSSW